MEMTIDQNFWLEFDRRLDLALDQKLEEKLDKMLDKMLEEKLDKMLEEKLDKMLDAKLDSKFGRLFEKHLAPFKNETRVMFNEVMDEFIKIHARLASAETKIEDMNKEMNERFDEVDNKFNLVYEYLSDHDEKFRIIVKQTTRSEAKIADMEVRVTALEQAA